MLRFLQMNLIVLLGLSLGVQAAYAQSKVLTYDKQGRVTGALEFKQKSKTTAPKPGASTFNPDTAFEQDILIAFDPPKGFERKIRSKGFQVLQNIKLGSVGGQLVRIKIPRGLSVKEANRVLSRLLPGTLIDNNTYFDPSAMGYLNRETANPRAKAGWEKLSPTCGKGLRIGQIDAGVDLKHPALKGQDIKYRVFTNPGGTPAPAGHGTAVAAMLVGTPAWGGLQPGATLFAANMFELNSTGKAVGSAIGLLRAVDWMIGQKVHAVNVSLAGSDNKVVRKAFDLAKKHNLILVASVGNWGRSDKPAFPAAYQHVLAVTAIKEDDRIYDHANTGSYVDFAAPGVAVFTAMPGGRGKIQSGTSYAAPYVTVMAAILSQGGKTPNVKTLRRILIGASSDLGRPGKDNVFGYGKIKARPVCKS